MTRPTPWSARPLITPTGERIAIQLLDATGQVIANLHGSSDEVAAGAMRVLALVNVHGSLEAAVEATR